MLMHVELMAPKGVRTHPSHLVSVSSLESRVPRLPRVHTSGARRIRYASLKRHNEMAAP